MKYFFMFLFLVIVTACNQTVDTAKEGELLLQTDKEFALYSVENGAAEAFNKYLADDALELPAGKNPVVGRSNIYDSMKEHQDSYTLDWSPQYAVVSNSGELGYTWGKYTLSYSDESGEEHKSYGKYLNIWEKQNDGSWKVAVDMGNASPKPE